MSDKTSEKTGRYLYAIIEEGAENFEFGPVGIAESEVYTIRDGNVSAVVSDVPNKKIRPQRKNLAAHQAVLKKIMECQTPLPMAFGIIADGDKAIKKIISEYRKIFVEQLKFTEGKVEMGVRVSFDVSNIFEYVISIHDELRALRDRLFGGYREPNQEAKMELGRMFDNFLNEDREEYTNQVEEVLTAYCHAIEEGKCRNEQEIMNLACLVDRDKLDRFEEGVFEAAGLFDNNFAFEYNGPWAPHNFVNIQLEL